MKVYDAVRDGARVNAALIAANYSGFSPASPLGRNPFTASPLARPGSVLGDRAATTPPSRLHVVGVPR